jgi:hypothetical protein
VAENWKKNSQPCKTVKTVTRREVTKNTESLLLLHNTRKTLPKRSSGTTGSSSPSKQVSKCVKDFPNKIQKI